MVVLNNLNLTNINGEPFSLLYGNKFEYLQLYYLNAEIKTDIEIVWHVGMCLSIQGHPI